MSTFQPSPKKRLLPRPTTSSLPKPPGSMPHQIIPKPEVRPRPESKPLPDAGPPHQIIPRESKPLLVPSPQPQSIFKPVSPAPVPATPRPDIASVVTTQTITRPKNIPLPESVAFPESPLKPLRPTPMPMAPRPDSVAPKTVRIIPAQSAPSPGSKPPSGTIFPVQSLARPESKALPATPVAPQSAPQPTAPIPQPSAPRTEGTPPKTDRLIVPALNIPQPETIVPAQPLSKPESKALPTTAVTPPSVLKPANVTVTRIETKAPRTELIIPSQETPKPAAKPQTGAVVPAQVSKPENKPELAKSTPLQSALKAVTSAFLPAPRTQSTPKSESKPQTEVIAPLQVAPQSEIKPQTEVIAPLPAAPQSESKPQTEAIAPLQAAPKSESKPRTEVIAPLQTAPKSESKPQSEIVAPPQNIPKPENKPPSEPLAPPKSLPKPEPASKQESARKAERARRIEPAPQTESASPSNAPIRSGTAPAKRGPRRPSLAGPLFLFAILGALVAAGIYFFGIIPKQRAQAELDHEQKLNTRHTVVYALARSAAPKVELPLPGTVEAFQQSSLYARTNGYVKEWTADIGDVVHEGDVLATLDTPEVDQQLNQAKASVAQDRASLTLAQSSADRWNAMVASHAVSQEEADEKNATLNVAKATLDAGLADVQRLTDLQNFKQIRAPFTGTVTFRHIEVGNLVSSTASTSSSTSGQTELYRIAQTDPLRVFVDVPEANSPAIHPGVEADLHVPAYPDRVFKGQVVRSAGALDISSRTLRTEVRVANPDGALLPGAYAEVRLQLVDTTPSILIPANTLIVNSEGTSVALVESNNGKDTIRLLPVKVGRDFGTEVEIVQDLKADDKLVTNPQSDLTNGMVVDARALPPPNAAWVPIPPTTTTPKS